MRTFFSLFLLMSFFTTVPAQNLEWDVVKINRQQRFKRTVPPANYSGIAHIHGNLYAVVDDKSPNDGFYLFSIDIDSVSGRITDARRLDFQGQNLPSARDNISNRDAEGIAFVPENQRIYISGERDKQVLEYTLDGQRTGRRFSMPQTFATAHRNGGLESLTYDAANHCFWTTTELPLPTDSTCIHRLQQFDEQLTPCKQLLYQTDTPEISKRGRSHINGISELLAIGADSLLVLERELYVPKKKIGARVINRLYLCHPNYSLNDEQDELGNQHHANNREQKVSITQKRLLCRWQTRLNLTRRSFANYEAMCLGPRLIDGSQVILLMADSQNHYKRLLRDWFRTIVVR